MPAYVRDLFGTMGVGSIYRKLPARAAAGFSGPVAITSLAGERFRPCRRSLPMRGSSCSSRLPIVALVGGFVNRTIRRVESENVVRRRDADQ
jgi:hypothetical protein